MHLSCIEEHVWEGGWMSETFIYTASVTLAPSTTSYKPLHSNLHVHNFCSHLVTLTALLLFNSGYT